MDVDKGRTTIKPDSDRVDILSTIEPGNLLYVKGNVAAPLFPGSPPNTVKNTWRVFLVLHISIRIPNEKKREVFSITTELLLSSKNEFMDSIVERLYSNYFKDYELEVIEIDMLNLLIGIADPVYINTRGIEKIKKLTKGKNND